MNPSTDGVSRDRPVWFHERNEQLLFIRGTQLWSQVEVRLQQLSRVQWVGLQWIAFLMFETLNSCRVLEKICRGVPSSPTSKRIRKGSSFPRKSARFISPICGGQLWGVTTSQIHSLLLIF